MAVIDLDSEFIELFYSITNTPVPAKYDLVGLKQQLITIVETMKELNKNAKKPLPIKALGVTQEEEEQTEQAILVVDDLGVITYQLKVLLSQFDIDVDCSQEIYDAANKFKKRQYQYVIMDLFIPTEREGFSLLTELKKMALKYDYKTIIGVITASPRKDIEHQCKLHGADFFLEKNGDWQNALLATMQEYIGTSDEEDF